MTHISFIVFNLILYFLIINTQFDIFKDFNKILNALLFSNLFSFVVFNSQYLIFSQIAPYLKLFIEQLSLPSFSVVISFRTPFYFLLSSLFLLFINAFIDCFYNSNSIYLYIDCLRLYFFFHSNFPIIFLRIWMGFSFHWYPVLSITSELFFLKASRQCGS